MHDIPEDKHENFRSKIKYISKRWNFITTEDLEKHLSGEIALKGRNVLLTFDDGFKSNRVVADEILEPLGIKALFFIIGNFVTKKTHNEQKKFIKENLYPKWRNHDYPSNIDSMRNMDIEDLNHLINNGHTIGFHSSNHKNLAKLESRSDLEIEIVEGARNLEKILGKKIKHFSFGFGNVEFFSHKALSVARSQFNFIHTGMRGNNQRYTPSWALRRDTISLEDSNLQIASFLEGSVDSRYTNAFKRYESWTEDVT